ncbi:EAL domain-containing protein [Azospirillum sp. SYSU D00513]|uniref:bifunctional diguanylate cyclase/phosphodiesterase n=1 Tax=Azospirillum sp. SYSU D00513 TaxID=2812561 RepID=UPI001A956DA7|nr:EAL domain-containing protein [Azospirillum sp. SYSU D00513]
MGLQSGQQKHGRAESDARSLNMLACTSAVFVLLSIVFALFVAVTSLRRIDAIALEHATAEVERALAESVTTMGKKALEYSLWNDAVENIVVRFDPEWVNDNTGPYAERLWHLDRSYAVDGRDRLIYASADGALRDDVEEAQRETAELRAVFEAARARPETLSGVTRIGASWYVFGAHVLAYEEGRDPLPADPAEPVQVFLKSLNVDIARIAASRQTGMLRFLPADPAAQTDTGEGAGEMASVSVLDAEGKPAGRIVWAPEQPGDTIIAELAPFAGAFGGAVAVLLIVFLRVLLRLKRQDALRLSEARLAQAQRIARLAYAVHLAQDVLEVSDDLAHLAGLPAGARLSSTAAWLDRIAPGQRQEVKDAYARAWSEGSRFDIEYPVTRPDGRVLHMHEVGEPFRDAGGAVLGLVTAIQDITDRKQAEEIIRYQASYDALTGLPNRTLFFDRLQQAIRRAARDGSRTALLFIDLNRFKWVNDTLGHGTGDMLLREAAQRLAGCIRESETIARLGGDEFTVILSDVKDRAGVDVVVRRILDRIEQPFQIAGQTLHLSASIGITFAPDQGTEVQQLVKNADVAMYQAKREGNGAWAYYAPDMDADAYERLRLENDLREAVARDELELHLQPIFDTRTGELAGAEALVRWRHPEQGLLLPASFIPVAEASGLIVPVGEWVLNAAARQLAFWQELGRTSLRLAVNISGAQIKHPDFEETVRRAIRAHGIRPDRLILEITENFILDPCPETLRRMQALRDLGVAFAVDDFGTGYSSLSCLKRLPVDILKVDQSFVQSMAQNEEDRAMVRAIVELAHSLRLQVIAEGIETGEQQAAAGQVDCGYAQGFFLGRPEPVEGFNRRFLPAAVEA